MKRTALVICLSLMAIGLTLGLLLAPTSAPVAQAEDNPYWDQFEMLVVRAYYEDSAMVQELAVWREPWEVNEKVGYVVVEVNRADYHRLLDIGFHVELDELLTLEMNQPLVPLPGQLEGIPGYPCYRTVEETFASAQAMVANYPQFATWIDIGDSWEKVTPGGNPGYDIMVLRLTNSAVPGPKPKLYVISSIHAREYTPAELNTRFAEYLLQNYGVDADVTWLLDYHEFHLLLQGNPDGRKQAETGLSWRKNTNENYCSPTSSNRGADMNRNYPFQWGCCGGSSGDQCQPTYRGPFANSEPETQAIVSYARSIFPDQRADPLTAAAPLTSTGIFLDVHSYSELVLWSWGFTNQAPPNTGLQTLGKKMAYFNNYDPRQGPGLYFTDGSTKDFAYGDLGVPGYTIELGTAFFQSCGVFENDIIPDNLPMLMYAAKASRFSYLTPLGPDAVNVTLSSSVVEAGTPVTLTATIDDTRYNNGSTAAEPTQPIAAAEYYVDVPPWVTTTMPIPVPMAAADGSFNTTSEGAIATIDTSTLGAGRHILYVRGQDNDGNWGAVSARFLTVVDPAIAPVIEGQVIAADTGLPLAATVQAGSLTQAATDPATGMYQMLVISDTYDLTAVPQSTAYGPATVPNVVAWNQQVVRQDFALCPYTGIFADDVESGLNGWTAQFPWSITLEMAHSPTRSWTDSPGGNYSNNRNVSLTSPALDLRNYSNVTLNYWQICDTEAGYDYCIVEVSPDDGVTWEEVARYDGSAFAWEEMTLAVPQLDGQQDSRIRFRLETDGGVTDDGWHVDDILVYGTSTSCAAAPTASFTAPAAVAVATPVTFTNSSLGANNSYVWDFGDGSPVVTETNPVHAYQTIGDYTVVLTATNLQGSSVAQADVSVLEAPQAGFTVTVSGTTAVFSNTSTGTALAYQWDFGDGSTIVTTTHPAHMYGLAGTYTVTLTAANAIGSSVAQQSVTITAEPAYKRYMPVLRRE